MEEQWLFRVIFSPFWQAFGVAHSLNSDGHKCCCGAEWWLATPKTWSKRTRLHYLSSLGAMLWKIVKIGGRDSHWLIIRRGNALLRRALSETGDIIIMVSLPAVQPCLGRHFHGSDLWLHILPLHSVLGKNAADLSIIDCRSLSAEYDPKTIKTSELGDKTFRSRSLHSIQ